MYPILIILLINLTGFALKYFNYDRFIILLGFRFHLSCLLPGLIFLSSEYRSRCGRYLKAGEWKKYRRALPIIILPLLIMLPLLYITGNIEISDPEYFYELGLSSFFDFPIYLIWNLPQLIVLALFLEAAVDGIKFKMPVLFVIGLLLFAYELIPAGKEVFQVLPAAKYAAAVVVFVFFFSYIKNIYLFSIALFFTLWSNILLFGSSSAELVKIFLAKNYEVWEGFFTVSKNYSNYMLLMQMALLFFLFLPAFILNSNKRKQ